MSQFRNLFRFALQKELPAGRSDIPENRIEKIGNWFAWLVYDFRVIFRNSCTDPRFITLLFTLFFMLLSALVFYPQDTWHYLHDSFIWVFEHIRWGYVRFTFWLITECTVVGLGMRAFGRFSNAPLMKLHGL